MTKDSIGLDLDAINARWKAATRGKGPRGEWLIEREELGEDFSDEEQDHAFPRTIGPIEYWDHRAEGVDTFSDAGVAQAEADAAFIASAPADVPTLVVEVWRLRAVVVRLWESGAVSEGQAAKMLRVDRLTAREIRDRIVNEP